MKVVKLGFRFRIFVMTRWAIQRSSRAKSPKTGTRWDGFVCKHGMVLEVGIWGNLPLDIQLRLLVCLPLPALARFQVVCKTWFGAIKNIKQVTAHGDCSVVRAGRGRLRVYSSLHMGYLNLPYPNWYRCLTCTSNGLLCFHDGRNALVYHPFTGKTVTVPHPPVDFWASFCGMQSGEELGDFTIVRVAGYGPDRLLLVYKYGRGTWEAIRLQMPADEEFSLAMTGIHSFHGKIDGSTLYFLTLSLRTPEMSLRWVDVLDNVTGISHKLFSWSSFTPLCAMYSPTLENIGPYGLRFTGNIAVVKGNVFMGCMRLVDVDKPKHYTVALFDYDKQGNIWKFVSEMPLTKRFVPWRPHCDNYVELASHGDTLIVSNFMVKFVCLYNTSTGVWSPLDGKEKLIEAWDFKLSLTCNL